MSEPKSDTTQALDVFEMAARAELIKHFGPDHVVQIETCLAMARSLVPTILDAVDRGATDE